MATVPKLLSVGVKLLPVDANSRTDRVVSPIVCTSDASGPLTVGYVPVQNERVVEMLGVGNTNTTDASPYAIVLVIRAPTCTADVPFALLDVLDVELPKPEADKTLVKLLLDTLPSADVAVEFATGTVELDVERGTGYSVKNGDGLLRRSNDNVDVLVRDDKGPETVTPALDTVVKGAGASADDVAVIGISAVEPDFVDAGGTISTVPVDTSMIVVVCPPDSVLITVLATLMLVIVTEPEPKPGGTPLSDVVGLPSVVVTIFDTVVPGEERIPEESCRLELGELLDGISVIRGIVLDRLLVCPLCMTLVTASIVLDSIGESFVDKLESKTVVPITPPDPLSEASGRDSVPVVRPSDEPTTKLVLDTNPVNSGSRLDFIGVDNTAVESVLEGYARAELAPEAGNAVADRSEDECTKVIVDTITISPDVKVLVRVLPTPGGRETGSADTVVLEDSGVLDPNAESVDTTGEE